MITWRLRILKETAEAKSGLSYREDDAIDTLGSTNTFVQ
jgi:hypothetical protein